MLEIGEKSFATRRPDDLDAALMAATGCTAAEHATYAARGSAVQLAQAAMPFLAEQPAGGAAQLAAAIDAADIGDVRRQVVALLTEPAPPAVPEPAPAALAPVAAPEPATGTAQ